MRRAALPSSGLYPLAVLSPDLAGLRRRAPPSTPPASPRCTSRRWSWATPSCRTAAPPGPSPRGVGLARPDRAVRDARAAALPGPDRPRRSSGWRSSPGWCSPFVARPLSVLASAVLQPMPWRELAFLSWAGLRGAVPIVLATIPLAAGSTGSQRLFDIVFVMVVIYTLLTGPTLPWAARRAEGGPALGAARARDRGGAARAGRRRPAADHDQPGARGCTASRSASCGCRTGASVAMVIRDGETLVPDAAPCSGTATTCSW